MKIVNSSMKCSLMMMMISITLNFLLLKNFFTTIFCNVTTESNGDNCNFKTKIEVLAIWCQISVQCIK